MKPSEKMKLFRAIESAGSRNGAQLENTAGAQRSNGGVKNTEKCRKRLVYWFFWHKIRTLMLTLIVSILTFLYGGDGGARTHDLFDVNEAL